VKGEKRGPERSAGAGQSFSQADFSMKGKKPDPGMAAFDSSILFP
jgi:hypothetical protein